MYDIKNTIQFNPKMIFGKNPYMNSCIFAFSNIYMINYFCFLLFAELTEVFSYQIYLIKIHFSSLMDVVKENQNRCILLVSIYHVTLFKRYSLKSVLKKAYLKLYFIKYDQSIYII